MKVFCHHLYEYSKGLRRMILHTTNERELPAMITKLKHRKIDYLVDQRSDRCVNLYFGDPNCIEVLKKFSSIRPDELSHEEDFILGTMLGYDCKIQCRRYVQRKERQKKTLKRVS